MTLKKMWAVMILTLLWMLALAPAAPAAVVGRFTLVTGEVDLLKEGKIPGVPAKVADGVEPGDLIRTKSRSKAQLQMVDDSIITMAPDSRLAVADYSFDPARGERHAALRVYRGLVRTVVQRLLNIQEPDFLMETHTAVFGVRGTDWHTLLIPNATFFFLHQGRADVRSNLASLPTVLSLQGGQYTQVIMGQQPRLGKPLTPAIRMMLDKMMETGVQESLILESELAGPEGGKRVIKLPPTPEQYIPPYTPPTLKPTAPPAPQPASPGPGPG